MDQIEKGKLIANLRKNAGYTQKELADLLFVTDKAISKWERGICLPDSSLLTKISMILDADIEYLLEGNERYQKNDWVGELYAFDIEYHIAGKPMIYYLLSYFMLAGIKNIYIRTDNESYIKSLNLVKYGLNIKFQPFLNKKTMIVYDKFFLFGVNITRQLQHCMSLNENIFLKLNNEIIPIIFSHNSNLNVEWHKTNSIYKNLGRGTIFILFDSLQKINDVDNFVTIYEKYHSNKISDLYEIAKNRKLI